MCYIAETAFTHLNKIYECSVNNHTVTITLYGVTSKFFDLPGSPPQTC